MRILVINSGSSSLKYQLFSISEHEDAGEVLCKGMVDRIGVEGSKILHKGGNGSSYTYFKDIPDHDTAIQAVEEMITHEELGVIGSLSEIDGIGHRVVHGGEAFYESILINEEVVEVIKQCSELAPLHNPPNLLGVQACKKRVPNIPQVAVFDTAFHQTMPKKAFLYALPMEQYTKFKIRRYGFHGTSHKYVAREAARRISRSIDELKIITCHLGNGCSITAIDRGKSVDTSMGFTPLEGLMMGTRTGDIDPYVPLYIMDREGLGVDGVSDLLNKESGLYGMCGKRDMRDVIAAAQQDDERAQLALDLYCYRIKKYIGAYIAVMNGVDVLVFTAGIGENSGFIREKVLTGLDFLGITIDRDKNNSNEYVFSTEDSRVIVMRIPTNEELVIAKDTVRIVGVRS